MSYLSNGALQLGRLISRMVCWGLRKHAKVHSATKRSSAAMCWLETLGGCSWLQSVRCYRIALSKSASAQKRIGSEAHRTMQFAYTGRWQCTSPTDAGQQQTKEHVER